MEPQRQFYFMDLAKQYVTQISRKKGRPLTFHVTTFGCQMNARDSEKLCGILETVGFEETDSEEADFVIYNTCTVRENANNKVYGRLGYLSGFKKKNKDMMIALCGCMMQEPEVVEKLKQSYRFVDLVFGTHNTVSYTHLDVYKRQLYGNRLCNITDHTEGTDFIWNSFRYSYRTIPYLWSKRRRCILCNYFKQPSGSND